jgi:hypothetical protein
VIAVSRWMRLLAAFVLLLAAACTTPETALLPTATLITPQPTLTATPLPPTATPQSLPAPSDLVEAAPPTIPPEATDDLTAVDPIAAELVALAQRFVADQNDLPVVRVRLVEVQPFTWTDSSLGCPSSDVVYAPVLVDGYRIVLTTGEQFHLFHTDFDRIIPCDPDNEQLPNTAEATPEVTESAG